MKRDISEVAPSALPSTVNAKAAVATKANAPIALEKSPSAALGDVGLCVSPYAAMHLNYLAKAPVVPPDLVGINTRLLDAMRRRSNLSLFGPPRHGIPKTPPMTRQSVPLTPPVDVVPKANPPQPEEFSESSDSESSDSESPD